MQDPEKTPEVALDALVQEVGRRLPEGRRVGILGSSRFHRDEDRATCRELGVRLASIDGLLLLTGGVAGIPRAVAHRFFEAREAAGCAPGVFHVLPHDSWEQAYGETLHAGRDMAERRELLGRLSPVYVVIEGGPGTAHEVRVAAAHGAVVLPIAASGGVAGDVYSNGSRPPRVNPETWAALGVESSTPESLARAVASAVEELARA